MINIEIFKQRCKSLNINYEYARRYWSHHPELTEEQVINYYLNKETVTIKELCVQYGLDYQSVKNFKRHNISRLGKEISNTELIKLYISDKPKTFKEKCEEAGVTYTYAVKTRKEMHKLTDDEIIEYCVRHSRSYINELCKKYKIDYNKFINFMGKHKDITIEQAIIHFRPDCYINILGELVIHD